MSKQARRELVHPVWKRRARVYSLICAVRTTAMNMRHEADVLRRTLPLTKPGARLTIVKTMRALEEGAARREARASRAERLMWTTAKVPLHIPSPR